MEESEEFFPAENREKRSCIKLFLGKQSEMSKCKKMNPPQSASHSKYLLTAHLWINPHLSERIMQNAKSETGSGQDLK